MESGADISQQSTSSTPMPAPTPMRLCNTCCKPFLKESSYNRHVLYCRRAQTRARTRARACRACNLAKVKCTSQPRCKRCSNKALDCIYDTREAPVGNDNSLECVVACSSPPAAMANITKTDKSQDWSMTGGAPAAEEVHVELDWDALDLIPDDAILHAPKYQSLHLPRPSVTASPNNSWISGTDVDTGIDGGPVTNFDAQDVALAEIDWSIRTEPRDEHLFALCPSTHVFERQDSDFLSPISMPDPVAKFTASIIMGLLRTFPQMMLRRETLPPFIHGHWYCASVASRSVTKPALPKPLENCIGIAQVFAARSFETKPFLWRTIQSEQRSASEQAKQKQISRHELLASIQAQLIYMIMRVVDDSHHQPGFNLEMLVIYQNLCESFKHLCDQPFCQNERVHPSISWEDWVFAESRRRTVAVWLLIAHMVYIKIGVPCDTFEGFRDIPLPSPKSLWDARSRSAWHSEYEIYRTMPRGGLDNFGDLMDASKQSDVDSRRVEMDAWNSTADNLGMLLNLAVSIM